MHMDIFKASERLMGMDEATWARHANPISVYTRFTALPLLCAAVLSRFWLGWWALVPIALVLVWTWLNPRLFSTPTHTDSWAARGVMGERVFLNRHTVPIPTHHIRWGYGLSIAAGLGVIPLLWGLWIGDLAWVITGLALSMGAKTWFVDRMTFLYDEMARTHTEYAAWARRAR